jgi:hypothetical protein
MPHSTWTPSPGRASSATSWSRPRSGRARSRCPVGAAIDSVASGIWRPLKYTFCTPRPCTACCAQSEAEKSWPTSAGKLSSPAGPGLSAAGAEPMVTAECHVLHPVSLDGLLRVAAGGGVLLDLACRPGRWYLGDQRPQFVLRAGVLFEQVS